MASPLYFTFPSPFSYLAWQRMRLRPERYARVELAWTPILYRRLMALQGGASGGSTKEGLEYAYMDAARWAAAYGVPFQRHERRDPVDQTAHKVHLLAEDAGGDWSARWREAVFTASRVRGEDITQAERIRSLASELRVPGLDGLDDARLDARLEANTQRALRDGVVGVPFILHAGQGYWGNDRLAWFEAHVAGKASPDVL